MVTDDAEVFNMFDAGWDARVRRKREDEGSNGRRRRDGREVLRGD